MSGGITYSQAIAMAKAAQKNGQTEVVIPKSLGSRSSDDAEGAGNDGGEHAEIGAAASHGVDGEGDQNGAPPRVRPVKRAKPAKKKVAKVKASTRKPPAKTPPAKKRRR